MERQTTEACCARRDDFCSSDNFYRFTNTKEQEGTKVLFHLQWNYNSHDQCNPLFPLRVTNAILCRRHSENVKGCEKSHAARQLLTEYLSEALEWELFKEDKTIKSIIRWKAFVKFVWDVIIWIITITKTDQPFVSTSSIWGGVLLAQTVGLGYLSSFHTF